MATVLVENLKCFIQGCNESYRDQIGLTKHLRNFHEMAKFLCLVRKCWTSFDTKHKLDNHIAQVHSKAMAKGKLPCNRCRLELTTQQSLSDHFADYHQLGHYCCSKCDFESTDVRVKVSDHLNAHRVAIDCGNIGCDQSFVDTDLLAEHIKVCPYPTVGMKRLRTRK